MGIKVYKEGSFVDANFIRRYNGSSWIDIAGGENMVKIKTGGPISTAGKVYNICYTNGKLAGDFYWVHINNLGFTPVLVTVFSGKLASITQKPFSMFNSCFDDRMKLGSMKMPEDASFTAELVKIPLATNISNDVWYIIAGY